MKWNLPFGFFPINNIISLWNLRLWKIHLVEPLWSLLSRSLIMNMSRRLLVILILSRSQTLSECPTAPTHLLPRVVSARCLDRNTRTWVVEVSMFKVRWSVISAFTVTAVEVLKEMRTAQSCQALLPGWDGHPGLCPWCLTLSPKNMPTCIQFVINSKQCNHDIY